MDRPVPIPSHMSHMLEDAFYYAHQTQYARQRYSDITQAFFGQLKQLLSTRTIALLPPELLCECFAYACAVDPHSSPALPSPCLMDVTALMVASVCRRWRDIILDMPLAWACIDFCYQSKFGQRGHPLGFRLAQTVRLYIERSQATPLSIRLTVAPTILRVDSDVLEQAYEYIPTLSLYILEPYLIPHAARWRHLSINMSQSRMPFIRPSLASTSLPNLETLSLESITREHAVLLTPAIASAPKLQHISMKGAVPPQSMFQQIQASRETRNWISTFVLDEYTYGSLAPTVPRLNKVYKLTILNPRYPSGLRSMDDQYIGMVLQLRALTVVFKEDSRGGPGMRWVAALTLPRLRELELIHPHPTSTEQDDTANILHNLFDRSGVAHYMRRLVLKGVVMWAGDLIDVLQCLSKLEELVLWEPAHACAVPKAFLPFSDDTLEAPHMISEMFCMRLACEEIVPRVKTLELVWACVHGLSTDAVLDMIEERTFTEVSMGTIPATTFEVDALARTEDLRKRGKGCHVLPERNL